MTRKRILTAAVAVAASIGVLGACTPEEVQQWQAWHAQDPAAAEAFLQQPAAAAEPAPAVAEDSVWDKVAYCESGGNWAINLGSGYYGGLQMLGSTWRNYGGTEFAPTADQASRRAADRGRRADPRRRRLGRLAGLQPQARTPVTQSGQDAAGRVLGASSSRWFANHRRAVRAERLAQCVLAAPPRRRAGA